MTEEIQQTNPGVELKSWYDIPQSPWRELTLDDGRILLGHYSEATLAFMEIGKRVRPHKTNAELDYQRGRRSAFNKVIEHFLLVRSTPEQYRRQLLHDYQWLTRVTPPIDEADMSGVRIMRKAEREVYEMALTMLGQADAIEFINQQEALRRV